MTWQNEPAADVTAAEIAEARDDVAAVPQWVRDVAANGVKRPLLARETFDELGQWIDDGSDLLPAVVPEVRYVGEQGTPTGWQDGAPRLPVNIIDEAKSSSRVTRSRKGRTSFVVTRRRPYRAAVGDVTVQWCDCPTWDVRAGTCPHWQVGAPMTSEPIAQGTTAPDTGTADDAAILTAAAKISTWYAALPRMTSGRLQALAGAFVNAPAGGQSPEAVALDAINGHRGYWHRRPVDIPGRDGEVMTPAIEADRALAPAVVELPDAQMVCGCTHRWVGTAVVACEPSPRCQWCKGTGWRPYLLLTEHSSIVQCSAVRMTMTGIDDMPYWARTTESNVADEWQPWRMPLPRPSDAIKALCDVLSDKRWIDDRGRNRHTIIRGWHIDGVNHVLGRGENHRGQRGYWIGTHRFVADTTLARWFKVFRGGKNTRTGQPTTRAARARRSEQITAAGLRRDRWMATLATLAVGDIVKDGTYLLSRPNSQRYVIAASTGHVGGRTPAAAAIKAHRAIKR